MSYNDWKNWETWNVVLWCDNEEGIYRARMDQKPRTADECEAFVREYFPNGTPDMQGDDRPDPYLHAATSVDWDEIASHWAGEYDDEDTENAA
jgi:hypothetical protein